MTRRALLAAGAVVGSATILAAGAAFAVSLPIAPKSLVVETVAATVPRSTCTLTDASADSYANQNAAGTNYGASTALQVRSERLNRNKRAFLQFDLASCSPAIPATARVTGASLSLFMTVAPVAARTFAVHRVTGAWTEAGLTWTNQPTAAATATSTATVGTTANVTVTWDVTADVAAIVAATAANNGWRISDQTEGANPAREAQFNAQEHATVSQRPLLTIAFYP